MSDHLATMNEQITSQNDKIDKLQQQLHINSKVITDFYCLFILFLIYRMEKKGRNKWMIFVFIFMATKYKVMMIVSFID
jgi:uncharacterized membrane protein YecN with MAPEG domain